MVEFKKAVLSIQKSKKYKVICEETIVNILEQEIQNHGDLKKAIGPARERLHKICAEYLGFPDFERLMSQLRSSFEKGKSTDVLNVCNTILQTHVSTRERSALVGYNYFSSIFDITGKPQSLADFACALNPFAFRWMGLPNTVSYHAYDINKNFTDFIEAYFRLEGLLPLVFWEDIYVNTPSIHYDVVFLFKMYHCLEHRRRGAGLELIKKINANWLAVSFPSQNLIGRKADIYGNYSLAIEKACTEMNWELQRLDFSNEVLILIKKGIGQEEQNG